MAHMWPLSLIQIWATPGPSIFAGCGLREKGLDQKNIDFVWKYGSGCWERGVEQRGRVCGGQRALIFDEIRDTFIDHVVNHERTI